MMKSVEILISALLGASLGLGGCATGGAGYVQSNVGYEKFCDSKGEYRLVSKNNDVYLEKLDGTESRQITHTPKIQETTANFSKNGKSILYVEELSAGLLAGVYWKDYVVESDKDDSSRREISASEYSSRRDRE